MEQTGKSPKTTGFIGGDVPDGLCYQWTEEYFCDMDAQEDKTDVDKAFVPKPYTGKSAPKTKTDKKPTEKKPPAKAEEVPVPAPAVKNEANNNNPAQMSLF